MCAGSVEPPIVPVQPASAFLGPVQKGGGFRVREYCKQMLTPLLDEKVSNLLRQSRLFQQKAEVRNKTKARAKQRLLKGLREVKYSLLDHQEKNI